MSDELDQFKGQKYLNVESYRKSGAAVSTPVWFAEEDGRLFIYSLADAGKVKRIRNNPRVRVVPCDFKGKPTGEWREGTAKILDGVESVHAHSLLDRKYGWMKKVGNLYSKLMNRERATIAIELK